MPIKKIKHLVDRLPTSQPQLIKEVNHINHFELARLLHQLSPAGKIHVFNTLDSNLKRQEFLYETDLDSRLEIESSLRSEDLAFLFSSMPSHRSY